MTSAGVKTSFAYNILLDTFEDSIIHPNDSIVIGCDYRVPVLHGLLDKTYVNKLKTSPSYSEESFAREYMSIWSGSSDDSWFNFDKLQKYRKIKNPETHAKFRSGSNQFYLISVDVGRINDQTVACVFRVNVDATGKHWATLVNIKVLARSAETKTFSQ
jgi:phage terminase large subunit-like protein